MTGPADAVTLDLVILAVLTGWPLTVLTFWLVAVLTNLMPTTNLDREGAS